MSVNNVYLNEFLTRLESRTGITALHYFPGPGLYHPFTDLLCLSCVPISNPSARSVGQEPVCICLVDIYVGQRPEDVQHLKRDLEAIARFGLLVLGSGSESFREKSCFPRRLCETGKHAPLCYWFQGHSRE